MTLLIKLNMDYRIVKKLKEKFKDRINKDNFMNSVGFGGPHELNGLVATKENLVSSDHGPPSALYKYANDPHVKNLNRENCAAVTLPDSVHARFITTYGEVTNKLMKQTGDELSKVWSNSLYDQKTRSSNFLSHMAALFKAAQYQQAIIMQIDAWNWSFKESLAYDFKHKKEDTYLGTEIGDLISSVSSMKNHGIDSAATVKDFLLEKSVNLDGQFVNTEVKLKDIVINGVQLPPGIGDQKVCSFLDEKSTSWEALENKLRTTFDQLIHEKKVLELRKVEMKLGEVFKPNVLEENQRVFKIKQNFFDLPLKEAFNPEFLKELSDEVFADMKLKEFVEDKPIKKAEPIEAILRKDHTDKKKKAMLSLTSTLKIKKLEPTNKIPQELLKQSLKELVLDTAGEALDRRMAQILIKHAAERNIPHILNPKTTLNDLLKIGESGDQKITEKTKISEILKTEKSMKCVAGTGITEDMRLQDVLKDKVLLNSIPKDVPLQGHLIPKLTLSSKEFTTVLVDFHKPVDAEVINMQQGIRMATEINIRNFYNEDYLESRNKDWNTMTDAMKDNLRNKMATDEVNPLKVHLEKLKRIAQIKDSTWNIMNMTPTQKTDHDETKKALLDASEEYQKFMFDCRGHGGRRRRSTGGGGSGCCICALNKMMPRKPRGTQDYIGQDEDGKDTLRQKTTTSQSLENVVALKHSIESGDFIDHLVGIGKAATASMNLVKLQVGKGSLKHSIAEKFKGVPKKIIHVSKATLKKFGSEAYGKLKNSQKHIGTANRVFMVRNLASGIYNEDIKSVSITVGLMGAGQFAKYLGDSNEAGKSLWGLNSKFLGTASKLIGGLVDGIGIGFDIMSIIDSVKCLRNEAKNNKQCQEEQDVLQASENISAIIITLETSGCAYDIDVCGGRDAVMDIVANGISIGISAVGLVCTKCLPVTLFVDFTVTRLNEIFQAGNEIEAFNKVIVLSEKEKNTVYIRKILGFGFSQHLLQLKQQKQEQTEVAKQLSSFLMRNLQFSVIVVPKKCSAKIVPNPDYSRVIEWFNNFLIKTGPLPTIWQNDCNEYEMRYGPKSNNIVIDLDSSRNQEIYSDKNVPYKLARWSPDTSKLPRDIKLFCPPMIRGWNESDQTPTYTNPPTLCISAIGLSNNRSQTNGSALINLAFHERLDPGIHLVWGYSKRSNIFILSNTSVNLFGGRQDDTFIIQTCCPTGSVDGGQGVDTLDFSTSTNLPQENYRNVLNFFEETLIFHPEQVLSVKAIEVVKGSLGFPETLVASCGVQGVDLGGGQSLNNKDEIQVPFANCTYQMLVEVREFTRAISNGQGSFNWNIHAGSGISLHINEYSGQTVNSKHSIHLQFGYFDIFQWKCSPMQINISISSPSGDTINNEINLKLQSNSNTLSFMPSGNLHLVTKTFRAGGLFQPSARIFVSQSEGQFQAVCLIHIDVNDDELYGRERTIQVKGNINSNNEFVIHPANSTRLKKRTISLVGGLRRNRFVIQGQFQGSIDGGKIGVNTLDFSQFSPEDEASELEVNFVSRAVLFQRKFMAGLTGTGFKEVFGRLNQADVAVCGCDQSYIDLRGGRPFFPDKIIIPEDECIVSFPLTINHSSNTYVENFRNQGQFVYIFKKDQMENVHINLTSQKFSNASHDIILNLSYWDVKAINLNGPDFQMLLIDTIGSFRITAANLQRPLNIDGLRVALYEDADGGISDIRIVDREEEALFVFDLQKIQTTAGVFSGHPEISNVFLVSSIFDLDTVNGGRGNDTFVLQELSNTDLKGHGGRNTLDLSQLKTTLNVHINVDLLNGQVSELEDTTDSSVVVQQNISNFQYILGSPLIIENIIVDCYTEFIDIRGTRTTQNEYIFVPANRFCESETASDLEVTVRQGTHVIIGDTSGKFVYKLKTLEIENQSLDFHVSCFYQDLEFGLCYGTSHFVVVDLPLEEFTTLEVIRHVAGHKTLSLIYQRTSRFNFTLELLEKSALTGFPSDWMDLFPTDKELKDQLLENPANAETNLQKDRLAQAEVSLDLRQETFILNFTDGSSVAVNRFDQLTIWQTENSCGGGRNFLIEILESKKFLAFRFGGGIIVTCKVEQMVLVIGGDDYVDFLENVASHETHLQGNFGMESVYSILPSKFKTYLHLSESENTRNVLQLSEFFTHTGVILEDNFPKITETAEGDLLLEISTNQQAVVIVNGVADHSRLTVVLRYSEFRIMKTSLSSDEEVRRSKAETFQWTLQQKSWRPTKGKEVVFISLDDLDTQNPVVEVPNGTSSDNSIFELDHNSIIVTNIFRAPPVDGSSTHLSFVILDRSNVRPVSDKTEAQNSSFIEKANWEGKIAFLFKDGDAVVTLDNAEIAKLPKIGDIALQQFYWFLFFCLFLSLVLIGTIILVICIRHRYLQWKLIPLKEEKGIQLRHFIEHDFDIEHALMAVSK